MSTTETDGGLLEALVDLVGSEGFAAFRANAMATYGPEACVQRIDAVLATLDRGDLTAATETVTQIRTAAQAVERVMRWPEEEIAKLKAAKAKPMGGFLARRRA